MSNRGMNDRDIEERLRDVVRGSQPPAPQSLHHFLHDLPETEVVHHHGPIASSCPTGSHCSRHWPASSSRCICRRILFLVRVAFSLRSITHGSRVPRSFTTWAWTGSASGSSFLPAFL